MIRFTRLRRGSSVPPSIFLPSRWRRNRSALVVVLGVVVALLGERTLRRPAGGSDFSRYHDQAFRVVQVVDGDTIDLDVADVDHPTTRVRLWGVDTPEVAHRGEPPMHFGPQAKVFAEQTLGGRAVYVVLNPSKTRDKYGRLLAYFFLERGGAMFNQMLVEEGHGYADRRFAHPYKEEFEAAERRARKSEHGLWKNLTKEQMPAWRQRFESEPAKPAP